MPPSPSRLAVALLALPLLAACAGAPATRAPAPAAADPAADAALAEALDAAAARWRDGLAAGGRGEPEAASAVREAQAELGRLGAGCLARPGCDHARVLAVYDALLAAEAGAHGLEGPATAGEGDAPSPVLDAMPAAADTITLLNGRELSELIAVNQPVQAAMTEWLTWMRPQLMDTWENYQHMRDLMWPEYQRAGLPEALLFGILAKESNGRVHAISRAGATGPLQFMPATGRRFGLNWVDGFDQRFDPQLSARANVAYLDEQFQAFNHDLGLALAAYNGGEGRVGRLYARSGGAGFWDPRVYGELPQETRDYVPFVLAAAWLFLHPEDYGLRFPRVNAGEPVQLELTRAMTLNEIAICLGDTGSREGWFRALRNLNPRWQVGDVLEPGTSLRVPPAVRRIYRRQCAEGTPLATTANQLVTASRLAAAAAPAGSALAPGGTSGPASSGGAARTYTVRSGDTLQAIARAQRCSVRAIASANGLRAPRYLLRVGQVLRIEGC